jgi:hypothetical protein
MDDDGEKIPCEITPRGTRIINPRIYNYDPYTLWKLVKSGADPQYELIRGDTAYFVYVRNNYPEHVMELVRCGHHMWHDCIDTTTGETLLEVAEDRGRRYISRLLKYTESRGRELQHFEDSVVTTLCIGKRETCGIPYNVWKMIARHVFDSKNERCDQAESMYDTILMCKRSIVFILILGKRRTFGVPYDVWRIIAMMLKGTQLDFNWILTPRDRRLGVHTWINNPDTYEE